MKSQLQLLYRVNNFARATLSNFMLGCKAALLLRVDLDLVVSSWLQIVAALILSLLPPLISQFVSIGRAGEFTSYGLAGIWFPFVVIFIFSVLATRLLEIEEKLKPLLLMLLNANIAIDAIIYVTPYLLKKVAHGSRYQHWAEENLVGYWLGLVFALLLMRLQAFRYRKANTVAMAMGVAILLTMNNVWQFTTLWTVPYDEADNKDEYKDYYAAAAEDVLYLQPKLLADRLQRLQSGPPGSANLYFLGVAGYAQQKVFLRELHSVEHLFLDKFTTKDRSLLLINNKETLTTDPIASTTSLQAAANRIAEVMDKHNDVLFIYLTSHGSKEEGFSLYFPPLQLRDLAPKELRKILDDAGIEWRVIVISACYSGTFVEPLASDKTLVITAAAADRTSFGCADENDFTYFGKAYFDEALAQTNSFIDAFELA